MIARIATIVEASGIWSNATLGDAGDGTDAKADAPTKYVWLAAGFVGAACFFGSFALLAMPFIYGWSWVGAGLAFVTAQFTSQVLLDLPEYWVKASAFLWIGWRIAKGDLKEQLESKPYLKSA